MTAPARTVTIPFFMAHLLEEISFWDPETPRLDRGGAFSNSYGRMRQPRLARRKPLTGVRCNPKTPSASTRPCCSSDGASLWHSPRNPNVGAPETPPFMPGGFLFRVGRKSSP
jgi:hypothetical protein